MPEETMNFMEMMRRRKEQFGAANDVPANTYAAQPSTALQTEQEESPAAPDDWTVPETAMTSGMPRKPRRGAIVRKGADDSYRLWDSQNQAWKPVKTFHLKSRPDGVDQLYWFDDASEQYIPFRTEAE